MNKKHCDHEYWTAKNMALYQQYREMLYQTFMDLQSVNYTISKKSKNENFKSGKMDLVNGMRPAKLGIHSFHKFNSTLVANFGLKSSGDKSQYSSDKKANNK